MLYLRMCQSISAVLLHLVRCITDLITEKKEKKPVKAINHESNVRARMSDSSRTPYITRWKRVTGDEWPLCLDVSCPETNKEAGGT